MILTPEEKKELHYEKLSPDLKLKIDAAFESPYFIIALAIGKQIQALAGEMIDNPFTIRGSLDITLSGDGEGVDVEKEDALARQRTETALKVLKELDSFGDKLIQLQDKLTPEELSSLNDLSKKAIVTATDLRKKAFGH